MLSAALPSRNDEYASRGDWVLVSGGHFGERLLHQVPVGLSKFGSSCLVKHTGDTCTASPAVA